MSIEFSVEFSPEDIVSWFVECVDDEQRWVGSFGTHQLAEPALSMHNSACPFEDCRDFGGYVRPRYSSPLVSVKVSMSSANGGYIADLLGIERDEHGCIFAELDPDDLEGRILLAGAIGQVEDTYVPATQVRNFIDCGRPKRYALDRFADILEVADAARTLGRKVMVG